MRRHLVALTTHNGSRKMDTQDPNQITTGASADGLFVIVLAAGLGSRFGGTKQVAVGRGRTLINRTTAAAVEVCGQRTVAVLGHVWADVNRAADRGLGFFALNEGYRDGMATSLAAGIRALPPSTRGALILLADQALITAADLRRLIETWDGSETVIVASDAGDLLGPPALFPRAYFAELAGLKGDQGARALLRKYSNRVTACPCPNARVDIDTAADLERLNSSALESPD